MRRLMVYNYEQEINLKNVNLGDYIQSIAANQFMKTTSRESYFSRDNLEVLQENDVAILNGWYRIERSSHYLQRPVKILPVSIHINNLENLDEIREVMTSWKKMWKGQIGCRDQSTEKFLKELGFDAYFSSCLTTTLYYQFGRLPQEERKGVIFCDVNIEKMFPVKYFFQVSKILRRKRIEKILEEILSSYEGEPREEVSHLCSISTTHEERFALALGLLKRYSKAKLVITSRIHCALPCIAMGTPVILLVRNYDQLRYPGIDQFLNKIYLSSNNKFVVDVVSRKGVVINNDKHIPYAEKLIKECEFFVQSSC